MPTTSSYPPASHTQAPAPDSLLDVWKTFASPPNDAAFCQSWLMLLCREMPAVSAAVVLSQTTDKNAFIPIAFWPDASRDLSALGAAAQRALVERKAVVSRQDVPATTIHLAYPIEVSGQIVAAVVLEALHPSDSETQTLLRQLHWGTAWLQDLFLRQEVGTLTDKTNRLGALSEILATAIKPGPLQQSIFDLANQINQQLHCARATIGMVKDDTVTVMGLSNAAWFEKNTKLIKSYVAAMESCLGQLTPIAYNVNDDEATFSNLALATLAKQSGAQIVLCVPLLLGATAVGVLLLEREAPPDFSPDEMLWVDAISGLLPSIIDLKRQGERNALSHLHDDLRALLRKLFGPRHLVWKFSSSLVLITLFALIFVHMDYRVSALTVLEGETQRAIVAPFDGFITASHVRPGDTVRAGQALLALDDRDLHLERNKWASEYEQHSSRLRDAMAGHDLSAIQIVGAQARQAEAQLKLVTERLSRARIVAPLDGIVIAGDLSQMIGAPVEQGKKLFEIAPLHAYRVVLKVDETELRHLKIGQKGQLLIAGLGGDPSPFSVVQITPVANVEDGHNRFRVEARLNQTSTLLRPGMEGVGKIEVGERRLWWILTHSFSDWLRLKLWSWLP